MLLLPFASKIALAVVELMQYPDQQHLLTAESDVADVLLRARLFTLMSTVLTLLRAAGEAIALDGSVSSLSQLTTSPCAPITVSGSAAAEPSTSNPSGLYSQGMESISRAVCAFAYSRKLALCDSKLTVQKSAMSVLLLFGAMRTWSCGLTKLAEHITSTTDTTTAPAGAAALVLDGLACAVTAVVLSLESLEAAIRAEATAKEQAPCDAAAAASSVTAAYGHAAAVPQNQQQGCNRSVLPGYHRLDELLQQGDSLKAALQSAIELCRGGMAANALV